ncbi:MAG: phosphate ABC transporter permease subunit PstC [Victivallaceae bacterium]|nr:phosphate ABC transporter permease subunit PstC [Victivallaceae bacterium]
MAILKKQFVNPELPDRLFRVLTAGAAWLAMLLLVGLVGQLFYCAMPAVRRFGFRFLVASEWDPVNNIYGALPAVTGTLVTTAIAIVIAVPISFIVAMYLVESAPHWLSVPISHTLDLLAAIPSIIYGMWGLFVFVPFMQTYIQPLLADRLGLKHLAFFGPEYNGFGFLTAGIILALMILPFICAVMRDVFRLVPNVLRESAFGAGATHWEVTYDIALKYGARGLLGAVFLGLGRAVGETMAILFVIGNVQNLPRSLFGSGTTIAATLANNFGEAEGILKSSLFELGLILLLTALGIQVLAQLWLNRIRKQMGEQ